MSLNDSFNVVLVLFNTRFQVSNERKYHTVIIP